MMRTKAQLLIATAGIWAVGLSGCAFPHRTSRSDHFIEEFAGRPDGLIRRETWRDREGGGALLLFADPTVARMSVVHVNQNDAGGGSIFGLGGLTIHVDTNLVPAIAATGTAVGNVVGAAVTSAAGKP
jgi:hypothetical protein